MNRQLWHMPLIPALERQRQEDLCDLEAILSRIINYRLSIYSPTLNKDTVRRDLWHGRIEQIKRKSYIMSFY